MLPLLLLPLLAAADAPPNILFVFTDDHASHAISAYGSKINTTPHIDRLAKEGMLFRNCFCTNSICAPSRAVILTGLHSHLNGVVDNSVAFDGSQRHVGKLMGGAGYRTALIGKWHLKSDPTGFDYWAVLSGAGGQGTYYNPAFKTSAGPVTKKGYCTDVTTDMALEWLKKDDAKKPFFLMFQHKAPHRSWEPGPNQLGLYRDKDIPEPPTLFDTHDGLASPAKKQEMTVRDHLFPFDLKLTPPGGLDAEQRKVWDAAYAKENEAYRKNPPTGDALVRWKYQRYIKDYLRCVAGVDDNLGRVLKHLDDTGLAKNTVVIYSSDQGFYLGDRGWYDKRWMYDESLRMPLIVKWPGVTKAGSENRDLVQNLDFAQTFLDIAGAKVPTDMQGASIKPLLKGETPKDWRTSIYYHYFEYPGPHSVARHYGVRTKTHKLIRYYQNDEWELFDLVKDPGERKSVYADPAYAEKVTELKTELDRLRKRYRVAEYKEKLPPKRRDPRDVKTTLELHLTFDDAKVTDVSANKHAVKLVDAKVVDKALSLDGAGHAAIAKTKFDPSYSPLAVGAKIVPAGPKGVIVAHGGESHGYVLHLVDGVPTFAVRVAGKLVQAKADRKIAAGREAHVTGVLDADGRLRVYIDGKASGDAATAGHLTTKPADGVSVGADAGSLVGEYRDEQGFSGTIADVRVYRGAVDDETVKAWAVR